MKRKGWITVFVLAAGCAGAYVLWNRSPGASLPAHEAALEELAQVKSELEGLKREQQVTRSVALRAISNAGTGAEVPARPGVASAKNETASAEPPAPRAEPTIDEIRGRLESQFSSQGRDPSWSEDASKQATQQLTTALPNGSRLVAFDCRQTLCRAEVTHADIAAHQTFVHQAFATPANTWGGPVMATLDPGSGGNGYTTIAYLARPGTLLTPEEGSRP